MVCLDVDTRDKIRVAKFCKHLLRGRHCCCLGPQRQISGARYHPFLHGPLLRHDEADPLLAVHGSPPRRCVCVRSAAPIVLGWGAADLRAFTSPTLSC